MTHLKTLTAALATTVALAAPAAASAKVTTFETPSGNIACAAYVTGDTTDDLQCDVRSVGSRFVMKRYTYPRIYRDGRNTLGSTRVLRYGRSIRMGPFRCSSRSSGLRCTNADDHGFFLSTQRRYRF